MYMPLKAYIHVYMYTCIKRVCACVHLLADVCAATCACACVRANMCIQRTQNYNHTFASRHALVLCCSASQLREACLHVPMFGALYVCACAYLFSTHSFLQCTTCHVVLPLCVCACVCMRVSVVQTFLLAMHHFKLRVRYLRKNARWTIVALR